jgi:hypothetical protein
MAKELAHILIAQDVIKQLQGSGQHLLAQVIKANLHAFHLGAIIPDAFFYDVIPFYRTSVHNIQISRALHSKDKAKNDQQAVSFFDDIADDPDAWPSKVAFAAGIVTHAVCDGIVHGLIDHCTTAWGEKGPVATASHRQIETLIDMVLLQQSRQHPGEFRLDRLTNVDQPVQDCLFHFYLRRLVGDNSTLPLCLLKAVKRAYAQQCLFLKLFTIKPLYHIMNFRNKHVASCPQVWSSLFYPNTVGTRTFPILHKLDLNVLSDGKSFKGPLASLVDEIITEAMRQINVGVRRLAT